MRVTFGRWAGPAAAGAALAVLLFAGYLGGREALRLHDPAGWLAAPPTGDLLAVGAAGALAAALGVGLTRGYYRRLLRQLGERVVTLQNNPAPHALHPLADRWRASAELAPLINRLEVLAGCYRKALADLVGTDVAGRCLREPDGGGSREVERRLEHDVEVLGR